ncbi:hypothetical protein WOLCODRAFT_58868, partial [Wolfiporia cocos MD-104 SS10]
NSWAGYAYEKSAPIHILHTVPNIIILSRDRHDMIYILLVRTLNTESEEAVRHTKVLSKTPGNGEIMTEHVMEEVPREQALKYIGEGNYKWSSIEVDTRGPDHPIAHIEIMVNG